jgi:hypothetical protein
MHKLHMSAYTSDTCVCPFTGTSMTLTGFVRTGTEKYAYYKRHFKEENNTGNLHSNEVSSKFPTVTFLQQLLSSSSPSLHELFRFPVK